MPTIDEVKGAARELAQYAKPDCAPEYLFWLADNAARRPQDRGFPRSYSSRPNWTANDLRCEISAVLWGKPTHPSRIPREFRRLPFRTLDTIASGRIESLWHDAPNGKVRHEWLAACSANREFGGDEWRQWLSDPMSWAVRHCPLDGHLPRSWAIANWLVAKKDWAGWAFRPASNSLHTEASAPSGMRDWRKV